jgi:hypothetical protein
VSSPWRLQVHLGACGLSSFRTRNFPLLPLTVHGMDGRAGSAHLGMATWTLLLHSLGFASASVLLWYLALRGLPCCFTIGEAAFAASGATHVLHGALMVIAQYSKCRMYSR